MTGSPTLRAFAIGLLGAIVVGMVFRDVLPVMVGMAIVGVVAGLVADGPRGLAGLWLGQLLSLAVLAAIQFGTDLNTLINIEDVVELLGSATFIVGIWLFVLGVAALGYIVSSVARTRGRRPAPR